MEVGTEDLSVAIAMRDVGSLIGCIIAALLGDRFRSHADLIIAVPLVFGAAGVTFKAYTTHLWLFGCLIFVEGLSYGITNTSTYKLHYGADFV